MPRVIQGETRPVGSPRYPQGTPMAETPPTRVGWPHMNSIPPSDGQGLFGLGTRLPPASLEAEQALLGALLANNKAYERVSEFLEGEHFADAIHGRIYSAIRRRVENGQLADAVTLRREFEHPASTAASSTTATSAASSSTSARRW
jgi:hypothetical protein